MTKRYEKEYYQMLIEKYKIAKKRGEVKKLDNVDELFGGDLK